ncbi:methyltransferase domain-containing protein [Pinibacter soli]|uniref:Methyltransferase domain-containing protein n=1 Tax=Pinibacter soli TaxID=3044211 RepID=A0ABT6REN4_9BACT|nr:methyltransferase domain-containing protein [Pinibacter soli]MDI3321038.1 methyltransferase domain-containing protein [Pinibacter soli]
MDLKAHWEKVYQTKKPNEVSWTQAVPATSLKTIQSWNIPKSAAIIDVGGGDSMLPDFLLEEGYENITVLDISAAAIERVKERLGDKAYKVKFVVSNILDFEPAEKFAVWHDRAAFHFLTDPTDIAKYIAITEKYIEPNGKMMIATFSTAGPLKCSGLTIHQYTPQTLQETFGTGFTLTNHLFENHTTPFNTEQNFLFASFERK